jgi:hypothetical protein
MPEESTRKLLKLFGVALTELEDQTKTMLAGLAASESLPGSGSRARELVEAWLRASDEATRRWQEVTQFLVETQGRGQAELVQAFKRMNTSA